MEGNITIRVTGFTSNRSTLVWSPHRSVLEVENNVGKKYIDCGCMSWNQAVSYCVSKGIWLVREDEEGKAQKVIVLL
jgi:hypothetical protein